MKRVIAFISLCIFYINLTAQVTPIDSDSSIFAEWYNVQQVNKDINLVGFGPWKINNKWTTPALFEAQIRQPFLLLKGRDNQRPWRRSLALSFVLGLNLRMYQGKGNESYPVRPINFMTPGITLDYFLNHLFRSIRNLAIEDSSNIKNYFNLQLYFSHYSNGQSGSFYNSDSSNNNFLNGNFSTNFFRPQISWSRYLLKNHLLTTSLSWTHDFGIGNALGIEPGLINSYGFERLGLMLQLRTGNLKFGQYKYRKAYYKKLEKDTTKSITQVRTVGKYNRYASLLLRAEGSLIIDNVDHYPTFKNPSVRKTRGNYKLTVGYYPANMRSLGLFASAFYGRDYYNIRFTDKLLNFKAGFLFDINKYLPPKTNYL